MYFQSLRDLLANHSHQTATRWQKGLPMIFLVLSLGACGGGGGGSDSTASQGEVLIALTDDQGDFVTYTVDVLSVKLTHANGNIVETLPLNTRVDFTRYTDLTEFVTAATVPNGRYVRGSIVLDYSNADIQVEDANGNAVPVASIVDQNGAPVTTVQTAVELNGQNSLPIAPGIPRSLVLDFDLEASNVVSFNGSEIKLTVDPVLKADVDPRAPIEYRVRGPLRSVNLSNDSFRAYIRPFFHPIRTGAGVFGSLKVNTSDQTLYEIDGVTYTGTEGLRVLEGMPELTAVIARGELSFTPLRLQAREVYAGSSVPGGTMDVVRGTVVERNGNVIGVKGATLVRTDGTVVFNDHVSVELGDSTIVTRQGSAETFGIQAVSVGQAITAFGTLTNDSVSDMRFSAANGYARMYLSILKGDVVQLSDNVSPLALDLDSINGRSVSLYDFEGTGADAGSNADPAFYEIETSTLGLETVMLSDHATVSGFATPFGTAAPDFTAQTVATKKQ